jgi:hypothetical protein
MTTDYKLTCIIIDDFTSRSLSEFSAYDIQYYDYAKSYTSYTVDSYGYYLGYDYGDVDSYGIVPGSESYNWYNLNDLTGQSLSSFTGYNYSGTSTGNFTNLYYGYDPEVLDYYYYQNIDAINDWSQSAPGHGDWVLKAFTDSLNDRTDVEIIAIDIDYDSSGDLNSLFASTTLNGKTVPFLTSLYTYSAFNDHHQPNEYHLLVGINASFTYESSQAIAAVENLLSGDMIIVQAAPNVNSTGVDWGQYLPNVVNVGAWNVDQNGYVLAANINSIDTVDVFANGYVQRSGWGSGWSFGTSFATPRVFADVVNLFDSNLLPLLDAGAPIPDSTLNLTQDEEITITNQIISEITSSYMVTLAGISDLIGPLNVSDKTIDDYGTQPIVVPISAANFGYILTNAQQFVNSSPTGSVTISGTPTQGQILTAANTLADVDGMGTVSYQWRADGTNISGATSTTFTLTQAQVGKAITVVGSYTDGFSTAESIASSATAAVANVNDSPTGSVTISGTPTQGQILTAANTLADVDGMGTVSYQWRADGTNISGATSSTFTLTNAQVGKTISVVASYTDTLGTVESKVSSATVAVKILNDAPSTKNGLATTKEDTAFTLKSNLFSFSDADRADTLQSVTISALPSNGTLLLNGASVSVNQSITIADINANRLVYTPSNNGNGTSFDTLGFRVSDGKELSSAAVLTLNVTAVNDAPTVANLIANQSATEGSAFSFVLPNNTFADVDNSTLTYRATLDNGKALPKWLAFNASTRTLSGTPLDADSSTTLAIRVTATDSGKLAISDTFDLVVAGVNVNPTSANATLTTREDTPVILSTKNFAFRDGDRGDAFQSLTIASTPAAGSLRLNGNALSNDAVITLAQLNANQLTYLPNANGHGNAYDRFTFKVGDSNGGLSTAHTMTLNVTAVNDAPTVANAIANQSATEGSAFSYTIPVNAFSDVDGGTLTYRTTLDNGKALPKWLAFNAATQTLSGTPGDADSSTTLAIRVTATDSGKLAISDTFDLVVAGVNVAPIGKTLAAVTATEGRLFTYNLPKASFTDGDRGDLLTYSSTNLPSWLAINLATGRITGTPDFTAADSSSLTVTIRATDRAGLFDTEDLRINLINTPTITGTAAANTLTGGNGADTIRAGAGDDVLTGGAGNDILWGELGNDTLLGGIGLDTLIGGLGNDILTGGEGNDFFLFNTAIGAQNIDTITDFMSGDQIQLSKAIFKTLTNGAVTEAQFYLGTAAHDATDRIIYDQSTGVLLYDADGTGVKAAVQIAIIGSTEHPALQATDLWVA